MKKFSKKLLGFIMVFTLLLGGFASPTSTEAETNTVSYVALGDSLAAGQTPYRSFGKGFSDFIADYYETQSSLELYSNKFAVSGYTTENVLTDLVDNKVVDGQKIKDALQDANVVTITAGANDVIKALNIDREKGTISFNLLEVLKIIQSVQDNYNEIFTEVKAANPDVEVYVSGYYNPFPYLPEAQQGKVDQATMALNNAIKKVAEENGATFVSLFGLFDDSPSTYLPNAADIHPSEEGYVLIADSFLKSMIINNAPKFNDVLNDNWAYNEISLLAGQGIMSGVTANQFAPFEPIKRSDVAKALLNVIPLEQSVPPNPGFSDVPESHDAYYAIAKLTQAGIFIKAEKFNPDAPLTRAQMAKVLTLALKLNGTTPSTFKDITNDHWAKSYIDALVSSNITTGYTVDNTFRPNLKTTRSQFAVFLVRSMDTNYIVE
ncbi:S-layer homology domain-containing protein [Bacillus sp. AK128]